LKERPIDPLKGHITFNLLFVVSSPYKLKFNSRGVRKVTAGITGLWRPSVHSDVAFWFFDVGSSYHYEAEFIKCMIVHHLIGNVSWV